MVLSLDPEVAELDARISTFLDVSASIGDSGKKVPIGGSVQIPVSRLLVKYREGLVIRAFVMLTDRVSNIEYGSLDVFFTSDEDGGSCASAWEAIQDTLVRMRTRISEAAIAARKVLVQVETAEQSKGENEIENRFGGLVESTAGLCQTWLEQIRACMFEPVMDEMTKALQTVDAKAIEQAASAQPPDLETLGTWAKSLQAKRLFSARVAFQESLDSYNDVCMSFGESNGTATLITKVVKDTLNIISVFTAAQCLVRKLKPGESRKDVAQTAHQDIRAGGGIVPRPLMMLVVETMGGSLASKRPASKHAGGTSAIDTDELDGQRVSDDEREARPRSAVEASTPGAHEDDSELEASVPAPKVASAAAGALPAAPAAVEARTPGAPAAVEAVTSGAKGDDSDLESLFRNEVSAEFFAKASEEAGALPAAAAAAPDLCSSAAAARRAEEEAPVAAAAPQESPLLEEGASAEKDAAAERHSRESSGSGATERPAVEAKVAPGLVAAAAPASGSSRRLGRQPSTASNGSARGSGPPSSRTRAAQVHR